MIGKLAIVAILLAFGLMALGFLMQPSNPKQRDAVAPARAHKPQTSNPPASLPATQEVLDRQDLIHRLQGQGIFGDVRVANRVGKVIVRPGFYVLDYKQRQQFCSVAMAWCRDNDPKSQMLLLLDSKTNSEVGTFNASTGRLEMRSGSQ